MKVIGFGHKKKVGKDTAVKIALAHLRQEYPNIRSMRRGFSDEIKDNAHRMFAWGGLLDSCYYDNHPEEEDIILPAIGHSPRHIWDEIGGKMRDISPKVWSELAFYSLDCDLVLFDGIRFPTEVEYVRKFGGKLARIDRFSAPVSDHLVDHALDNYDGWDATFENNGTIREFGIKIRAFIDSTIKEWDNEF